MFSVGNYWKAPWGEFFTALTCIASHRNTSDKRWVSGHFCRLSPIGVGLDNINRFRLFLLLPRNLPLV